MKIRKFNENLHIITIDKERIEDFIEEFKHIGWNTHFNITGIGNEFNRVLSISIEFKFDKSRNYEDKIKEISKLDISEEINRLKRRMYSLYKNEIKDNQLNIITKGNTPFMNNMDKCIKITLHILFKNKIAFK